MAFSAPDGYSVKISMDVTDFEQGTPRTYPQFDRDREEVTASLLCNGFATSNAWKIDERRLYDAFLPLCSLYQTLGEAGLVSESAPRAQSTYRNPA